MGVGCGGDQAGAGDSEIVTGKGLKTLPSVNRTALQARVEQSQGLRYFSRLFERRTWVSLWFLLHGTGLRWAMRSPVFTQVHECAMGTEGTRLRVA